jgi:hypothetical protein
MLKAEFLPSKFKFPWGLVPKLDVLSPYRVYD